ncbi:MAG: hypothetical protein IKD55_05005 [Sediminibacterium sp.]|nr:hypothetical protein [Sediminibacterium sp.]
MKSTLKKKDTVQSWPTNWHQEENSFTGDDLIDAYLKGKQAGRSEMIHILSKQFETNLSIATTVSEKLFLEAKKKKILPKEVHLKADGITNFSALFVVDKNDFISDNFRQIFTLSRKLKAKVETENFYINFTFLPISNNLNEKNLHADGYFLKYEKK